MPQENSAPSHRRSTLVWLVLLLVVLASVLINITLQSAKQQVQRSPIAVSYLHDAAVQTPEQALRASNFLPLPNPDALLGYGLGPVWFKLQFDYRAGHRLELAAPFLDQVNFYQLDAKGQVLQHLATGDALPWSADTDGTGSFVFTPTAGDTVLVQVQNIGGLYFPIRYSETQQQEAHNRRQQLFQGLFYGILLCAAFVTLVFGVVARDDSLAWFALLILAITAVQAELQGFSQQWLWPDLPHWNHLIDIGMPLALLAAASFVLRYFRFDAGTGWARLLRAMQGLALVLLLSMVATMVLELTQLQSQLKHGAILLLQGYAVLCLVIGIWQLSSQRQRAWHFLLPMLVLLGSILVSVARVLGYIPENGVTLVSLELGTTLAALLMAVNLVTNEYLAKDTLARTQKALLERNLQLSQLQQAELARSKISPFYGLGSRLALTELLTQQMATGLQKYRLLVVQWQSYDRIEAVLGRQKTQHILQTYLSHLHQYCLRQGQGLVSLGPDMHHTLYALSQDKIAMVVQEQEFAKILNSIRKLLHQKYRIDGLAPDFRPRYGSILVNDAYCVDAEELIAHASLALNYLQRDAGHLSYQPSFSDDNRNRVQLLTDLTKAISSDQFELVYQPIIDLNSQSCIAVEALLRWPHPTLGLIAPSLFIPLAEDAGLMNMISAWVYKEARRTANAWQQQGLAVPVSINLSGKDIENSRLLGQLVQHELQYPAVQRLWLEFAENAVDTTSPAVQRSVDMLKKAAFDVILDDFGAGQSMLTKLGSLPLRAIKLDMTMLSHLGPQKEQIFAGAVQLARELGLQVLCKGVETQQQLNFLMLQQVDAAQGFVLAKPMAAAAVPEYLRQQQLPQQAQS